MHSFGPTIPAFVHVVSQFHLPWPEGMVYPQWSCPNKPPSYSSLLLPEHDALSDDTTATAAHYSGQPFGLLKDVLLSVLLFKAWSVYNLSRPLENNAEDHYVHRLWNNATPPPLFFSKYGHFRALQSFFGHMQMTM